MLGNWEKVGRMIMKIKGVLAGELPMYDINVLAFHLFSLGSNKNTV